MVHAQAVSEPVVSTPQPRRPPWRPPGPPDNEVPHSVPVHTLLGRGPDAVMFLTGAQGYSTGVAFSVAVRLRRRFDDYRGNIHMELIGGLPRGASHDPDSRLMMGVEFSDGRRASMRSALDPSQRADTSGDSAVVSLLAMPAGSVSELSLDSRLWMRPLPTPGPLLMVIRWQALGIEETVAELDGTALATAGASATILWPPVPPDDRQPPPPTPPPTNGWFADNR